MRAGAILTLAAAALLCGPARAQDIPELSVGDPILTGKDAVDPVKKSRTPAPPPRGNVVQATYTEGNYFTVTLPLGWKKMNSSFSETARKKKVYGAELLGPAGAKGVTSRIGFFYYSPGNGLQKTSDEYVSAFSTAPAGAGADSGEYGKVRDEAVAGRSARLFDRIVFVSATQKGKRKKVPVYEYFAVIPASQGFYVLKYSAPKDIAKTNIKAFEDLLDSFVPLVK